MKKKKVIIIGAGPAGLTAAYELLKNHKKEYDVVVYECDKQVGGISTTINYKGYRMDLGGHRFFTKDEKVKNWWFNIMDLQGKDSIDDIILHNKKNLKIDGPDPEKQDDVFLIRRRISRIFYKNKFFDYPVKFNFETIKNLGFVTTMKGGFSYLFSCVFKKKEDNLENFYINRFGKKLYSIFFEGYTEKLWGRHPREIDASWGNQRVKGLSIIAIFKDFIKKNIFRIKESDETSLIEEFYYPKLGPGALWEKTADLITKMGGKVILNTKVIKINEEKKEINSIVILNDGVETTVKGDIFISSMPIKDLVNGFKNAPKEIVNITNNLPYRDFVTVGVLFKKIKLKNLTKLVTINDNIPDCWIYVQDSSVKLGRIQVFNNWSPYLVKDIKKDIWLGLEYFCNENDDFWNMKDEDRLDFALDELIKMGIIDSKEDIIDYHVEKVKKAYPAYFDTYKDIDKAIKYLNKFDNLYCIGRNGQHRYNNIDHSMLTAFNAVDNIVSNKKKKDNIWNVNTESVYHEKK